jgi:NDP-sugar pyrophosphorylase family protein
VHNPSKNTSKTLLILAAGMGSRYGGLKQTDPLGPAGESIMEFSIYDAISAGFSKIVFVIRKSFEESFREIFVNKLSAFAEVHAVFQEMENLPVSWKGTRQKPWGTAHAVWCAREVINEPFAMINADDYYGRDAFRKMADFFENVDPSLNEYAMCGYRLANTLSEHGSVARGVCNISDGWLQSIEEHTQIIREVNGEITDSDGNIRKSLSPEMLVSMNFWGFTPKLFDLIEEKLITFLEKHAADPSKEIYIPFVLDSLIREKRAGIRVIESDAEWFGITYPEDAMEARRRLLKLAEENDYPSPLWKKANLIVNH